MRGVYSGKNIMEIQHLVQAGTLTICEGIQEIVATVENSPAYRGSPNTFNEPLNSLRASTTLNDFDVAMNLLLGRLVIHFTGKSLPSITQP